MDKMDKVIQYKAEDIFFDDPNDPIKDYEDSIF